VCVHDVLALTSWEDELNGPLTMAIELTPHPRVVGERRAMIGPIRIFHGGNDGILHSPFPNSSLATSCHHD
jgi:hypothetical protein